MYDNLQQPEPTDKLDGIVKPVIYSKQAIWGFSVFFTPLFGGILFMQNLKDISKRKEANLVLVISLLLTALIIFINIAFDIKSRYVTFLCNLGAALILSEYYYKKYFPDEADYEKKKIWKPLIIGILICVAFVILALVAENQAAQQ